MNSEPAAIVVAFRDFLIANQTLSAEQLPQDLDRASDETSPRVSQVSSTLVKSAEKGIRQTREEGGSAVVTTRASRPAPTKKSRVVEGSEPSGGGDKEKGKEPARRGTLALCAAPSLARLTDPQLGFLFPEESVLAKRPLTGSLFQ